MDSSLFGDVCEIGSSKGVEKIFKNISVKGGANGV
jgi:hypothetical protein